MESNKNSVQMSAEEELQWLEVESKRLALEIQKQQLEALSLERQERTYHIQDLKSSIGDRDLREKQLREDREAAGRTFSQQAATDLYRWKICTHRKGGVVTPRDMRVLSTGGNKDQFAIIRHQMINGDIWVRCLRCGKTWQPPVKANFYYKGGKVVAVQDGVFNAEKFAKAQEEYEWAKQINTNNSMSGSVQCRFTRFDPELEREIDAADKYRESVASTNLR